MQRREFAVTALSAALAPSLTQAAELSTAQAMTAYRKIFASAKEEDVVVWYLGTMFVAPEGEPEIPVFNAETIMVYRADDRAPGGFRVRWTEVGLFRDPVTGKPMETWLNPLTGGSVKMNRTFRDRPGLYTVTPSGTDLSVKLDQTGATVERVDVTIAEDRGRLKWNQVERKIRGVKPGMSDSEIATLPRAVTTLTLWSDAAEVNDPARAWANASGTYSFSTAALPTYVGRPDLKGTATVRGIMRKAAVTDKLNPTAWEILREAYPDFFDSDRIAPKWS